MIIGTIQNKYAWYLLLAIEYSQLQHQRNEDSRYMIKGRKKKKEKATSEHCSDSVQFKNTLVSSPSCMDSAPLIAPHNTEEGILGRDKCFQGSGPFWFPVNQVPRSQKLMGFSLLWMINSKQHPSDLLDYFQEHAGFLLGFSLGRSSAILF